jgi:hypothetical protein
MEEMSSTKVKDNQWGRSKFDAFEGRIYVIIQHIAAYFFRGNDDERQNHRMAFAR